jgi:hypothetical protein
MPRFGMNEYIAVYEKQFVDNLKRYAAMKKQIKQRIEKVIQNPYVNTELLADANDKLNLIGCRSIRIDRNFRHPSYSYESSEQFMEKKIITQGITTETKELV